jgi:hypothetical protein
MHAQAPDTAWTRTYGGEGTYYGYAAQQTADNGYIIAGSILAGSEHDVYLLKTNEDGDMIWQRTYGETSNDQAFAVQQTSDGGYIITGYSRVSTSDRDIYVIKTYPDGSLDWANTYNDIPGYGYDEGYSVIETNDGCYMVAGRISVYNAGYDAFLMKLDQDGAPVWSPSIKHYGGILNAQDRAQCVQQTSDNGYVITGYTQSFGNADQVYLVKTDAQGNQLWEKNYGGAAHDRGYAVKQTTDGGNILVGQTDSYGVDEMDVYIIRTNATGDTVWTRTYGGLRSDEGRAIDLTTDGCYVISGTQTTAPEVHDVLVIKIDDSGTLQWAKTVGTLSTSEYGYAVEQTADYGYMAAGFNTHDLYFVKLLPDALVSNDPLSLAYNSNRHFVRKHNSYELHLVYTASDRVCYSTSTNAGQTWQYMENLGTGAFSSICLATDNLPVVTWTDDEGGLWYSKQTASGSGNWSTYHLYDPAAYDPYLNTPPSIAVTRSLWGDTVHILASLFLEDIEHLFGAVVEYAFPISNPNAYTVNYIEGGSAPNHKFCYHPSLTKDYQEQLHAVWQRADTICYATRHVNANWNNWGNVFDPEGLQSAHPFVETYGDRVFVVWQHTEASGRDDVYRGWRFLGYPFDWHNLSETYTTVSAYPVNASGLATAFIDEEQPPPPDGQYEVYWKRIPNDPLNNISTSPRVQSIYPHTSLRYNQIADNELFVVWQEGNTAPYQIKCEKVYVPDTAPAFFSSRNGTAEPSAYVTMRDTFNSTWQIPADIGTNELKYRFVLEPGYGYKVKAVLYQEFGSQCKARFTVDNNLEYVVQYNSALPKVVEAVIPPRLYADSVIEMSMQKISGAGAALGPVYIYRYEDASAGGVPGGPMAHDGVSVNSEISMTMPSHFKEAMAIRMNTAIAHQAVLVIYDVAGRKVKNLHAGQVNTEQVIIWHGTDNHGQEVAQGIYFVQLHDLVSGNTWCHKVLKVE